MKAETPGRGPLYPYYVLGVLFSVSVFNFVDRQLVSVLLQPIKDEFQVSDAWMGGPHGIRVHARPLGDGHSDRPLGRSR